MEVPRGLSAPRSTDIPFSEGRERLSPPTAHHHRYQIQTAQAILPEQHFTLLLYPLKGQNIHLQPGLVNWCLLPLTILLPVTTLPEPKLPDSCC